MRATDATRAAPFAWDEAARRAGERHRVFCASLADVLDDEVPVAWREELWQTIALTTNLDWLLLTKRAHRLQDVLYRELPRYTRPWPAQDRPCGWSNVWLGVSVENQECANQRIPLLQAVPAKVRFLSIEPLLGPIDLSRAVDPTSGRIHWVIVGGESGPRARPMDWAWVREIRSWCCANGAALYVKQAGRLQAAPGDAKGTRWDSLPPDLLYRKYPKVTP